MIKGQMDNQGNCSSGHEVITMTGARGNEDTFCYSLDQIESGRLSHISLDGTRQQP
jgi:hypothetical protein